MGNLGRKIKKETSGRSECVHKELKPVKEQMWCCPGQEQDLELGRGEHFSFVAAYVPLLLSLREVRVSP